MPATPTRFVVMAASRTGSTWVMDTLGSHPLVTPYYELFNEKRTRHPIWADAPVEKWVVYRDSLTRLERLVRVKAVFDYLDGVFSTGDPSGATGFKLMYPHLKHHPEVAWYLRRREVKIIHLIRWNHLDGLVSQATARARGEFHAVQAPEGIVAARLETADLLAALRRRERNVRLMRAFVARLGCPLLEVDYEALAADRAGFEALIEYLLPGAAPAPLASRLHKLNDARHRDLIENYDDVKATVAGTRFEALLG